MTPFNISLRPSNGDGNGAGILHGEAQNDDSLVH